MIAGAFSEGCNEEEPKPDYINVNVQVEGYVHEKDSLNATLHSCTALCENFQVEIEIVKAGGETFKETQVTDDNCRFTSNVARFDLYREQPIRVHVYSKNNIPGYLEHGVFQELTWDEVYPATDFGELYIWYPYTQVFLIRE